jgi:hypothetical protein
VLPFGHKEANMDNTTLLIIILLVVILLGGGWYGRDAGSRPIQR